MKDGVTVLDSDETYIACSDADDYHAENTQRQTEVQRISDGEVIARLWWVRQTRGSGYSFAAPNALSTAARPLKLISFGDIFSKALNIIF